MDQHLWGTWNASRRHTWTTSRHSSSTASSACRQSADAKQTERRGALLYTNGSATGGRGGLGRYKRAQITLPLPLVRASACRQPSQALANEITWLGHTMEMGRHDSQGGILPECGCSSMWRLVARAFTDHMAHHWWKHRRQFHSQLPSTYNYIVCRGFVFLSSSTCLWYWGYFGPSSPPKLARRRLKLDRLPSFACFDRTKKQKHGCICCKSR